MRTEGHLGGQVERCPGQLPHIGAVRVPAQPGVAVVAGRQHSLTLGH